MSRASAGNRHQITIQIGVSSGLRNIQAVCVCENLKAPARFSRTQAEEDGRDHLLEFSKQGMTTKRGRK